MYEQHVKLRRPENSRQWLWRYMPLRWILDLLSTGEIFFTNLSKFSDGLEGALTDRTREHLATWFRNHNKSDWKSAYEQVNEYQKWQHEFFANCWHMNHHESYLMWKAYAGTGYAYAIQSNFERVQAAFEHFDGSISGGVVNYVDFTREITPVGNIFDHVITKDIPYRDEREFRLVFWSLDPKNQRIKPVENGVRIPVDVRMLIDRVVISPFEKSLPCELEKLLEEMQIPVESSIVKHRS